MSILDFQSGSSGPSGLNILTLGLSQPHSQVTHFAVVLWVGVVKGSDSPKEFTFLQSLSAHSSSARGAAKEVKTVFHKLLPTPKL